MSYFVYVVEIPNTIKEEEFMKPMFKVVKVAGCMNSWKKVLLAF